MDEVEKAVCKTKILMANQLLNEVLGSIWQNSTISREKNAELTGYVIKAIYELSVTVDPESSDRTSDKAPE